MITRQVVSVADREPRTVRVDPDLWAQFREQIAEWDDGTGGHVGQHVENALSEYIDHDRYARVEEKLDEVLAHVSDSGGAHTHTTQAASETVEKARDIHRRLAENHDTVIRGADVERAIEDMAGADPRTIEKYEQVMMKRGLLYAHPDDDAPVWTTDTAEWARWAEQKVQMNPTFEVHDAVAPYSMTPEEYDDLLATHEIEVEA
jgi:hypothetical protein